VRVVANPTALPVPQSPSPPPLECVVGFACSPNCFTPPPRGQENPSSCVTCGSLPLRQPPHPKVALLQPRGRHCWQQHTVITTPTTAAAAAAADVLLQHVEPCS
jgi:hypothetical protein